MTNSALAEALEIEQKLAVARAQRGLLSFTLATKSDFEISWHHRAVAKAVNALERYDTVRALLYDYGMTDAQIETAAKRPHEVTGLYCGMTDPNMLDLPLSGLQVMVHPRAGKTELISRRTPAWWLGRNPDDQIVACSYGAELAARNNRDVQRCIDEDETYAKLFPGTKLFGSNVRSVAKGSWLRNSDIFEVVGRKGCYKNSGVGGPLTGLGANLALVDDLTKNRAEAESAVIRERNWDWYTSTLYTRLEKKARKITIGTRWHAADISGKLLDQAKGNPEADQWFCLVFPAILDCEPGPADPRQQGEALWPDKYNVKRLSSMRASVGAYEWEALYQQRPSPRGGGIIKESWWKYYDSIPTDITKFTLSVDLSFESRGDYSAFTVWGSKGADHYLLDLAHYRIEFNEQVVVFEKLCQKWPRIRAKLVENAANGAALVSTLKRRIPGIIPVRPEGSKQLRVDAVAPMIEAGNVWLPTAAACPWIDKLVYEFSAFPAGAHDDIVDSVSQFLNHAAKIPNYLSGTAPGSITRRSNWL